jgi:DNA-binding MarR family transcriptional regulator
MKRGSSPPEGDNKQTLPYQTYLNLQKILRCLNIGRSFQGKRLPITITQMRALSLFNEKEAISISDISRSLLMSLQSATNLIRRLEVLGYLERSKNRSDKRISDVRLTAKGKKRLSLFRSGELETVELLFNRLTSGEKKTLNDSLTRAACLFERAILNSPDTTMKLETRNKQMRDRS